MMLSWLCLSSAILFARAGNKILEFIIVFLTKVLLHAFGNKSENEISYIFVIFVL